METTEALRKKFCKDTGLPITVFTEPYFSSRLELFEATEQYNEYMDMVSSFDGTDTSYFDYYNSVSNRIIEDIKNSDIFKTFNEMNMYPYSVKRNIPDKDIYSSGNIGKKFISLDMSKANYTAFVHYELNTTIQMPYTPMFFNPNGNVYDYKAFISKYTDNQHIINSKNIRQIIFGNCNPKRQQTYQKYLMNSVLSRLFRAGIPEDMVMAFRSDEIIIAYPEDKSLIENIETIVKSNDFPLRYETFTLMGIMEHTTNQSGRMVGYIKASNLSLWNADGSFNPDSCELKCVSAHDAAPVMRYLKKQPIEDNDLVFVNDNRLAKYITIPELRLVVC